MSKRDKRKEARIAGFLSEYERLCHVYGLYSSDPGCSCCNWDGADGVIRELPANCEFVVKNNQIFVKETKDGK